MIQEHFSKLSENASFLLNSARLGYLQRLLANGFGELRNLDRKGAVDRSMKSFFTEFNENEKEVKLAKVCKAAIVGVEKLGKETDKARQFAKQVCEIGCKDDLHSLFKECVKVIEDRKKSAYELSAMIDELYDILKPYFDFLRGDGEVWEFKTLFYYMLAIDTVIETEKIGMVNY